jgi:hypothetical protein
VLEFEKLRNERNGVLVGLAAAQRQPLQARSDALEAKLDKAVEPLPEDDDSPAALRAVYKIMYRFYGRLADLLAEIRQAQAESSAAT